MTQLSVAWLDTGCLSETQATSVLILSSQSPGPGSTVSTDLSNFPNYSLLIEPTRPRWYIWAYPGSLMGKNLESNLRVWGTESHFFLLFFLQPNHLLLLKFVARVYELDFAWKQRNNFFVTKLRVFSCGHYGNHFYLQPISTLLIPNLVISTAQ